jgi:hypothetical protein
MKRFRFDTIFDAVEEATGVRADTAVAGGTGTIRAILPDGRLVAVTDSDSPFMGTEGTVDVKGFCIETYPSEDAFLDGQDPLVSRRGWRDLWRASSLKALKAVLRSLALGRMA